uniref:Uncharacterized protein n=1 Tax=Timema cristinae TaxID=61476 RepID=A0A7R9D616_TIMCR|nr:unnamed protein product [Timema cristinae]
MTKVTPLGLPPLQEETRDSQRAWTRTHRQQCSDINGHRVAHDLKLRPEYMRLFQKSALPSPLSQPCFPRCEITATKLNSNMATADPVYEGLFSTWNQFNLLGVKPCPCCLVPVAWGVVLLVDSTLQSPGPSEGTQPQLMIALPPCWTAGATQAGRNLSLLSCKP